MIDFNSQFEGRSILMRAWQLEQGAAAHSASTVRKQGWGDAHVQNSCFLFSLESQPMDGITHIWGGSSPRGFISESHLQTCPELSKSSQIDSED